MMKSPATIAAYVGDCLPFGYEVASIVEVERLVFVVEVRRAGVLAAVVRREGCGPDAAWSIYDEAGVEVVEPGDDLPLVDVLFRRRAAVPA
jgi:hypothetical protein